MHIEAVIGSNYGDEGKGLFTEYLCRNRCNPLVVLSNGGCQRGHTVNNVEKNIRHVFHHFGSGTLLGKPSVYAKTFLLNPIKYVEEKHELGDVGIIPIAFRAPSCILQLPGDMFINQMLEKSRGKNKHGSCGWGIWETVLRNQREPLSFEDFSKLSYGAKKDVIVDSLHLQIVERLDAIDVEYDDELYATINSEGFINHFISDFEEMANDIKMLDTDDLLKVDWKKHGIDVDTIIVENGQGLLLDQMYAPSDENGRTDIHATPSKCGLKGSLEALGNLKDIDKVTANYISRTYFTRHGAGPFPEMTKDFSFDDKTNVYNEYQDAMHFGKMTVNSSVELLSRIFNDGYRKDLQQVKNNLVLTHCNEVEPLKSLKDYAHYLSYEDDSRKVVAE